MTAASPWDAPFELGGLRFRRLEAADLPMTLGWRNQDRARRQFWTDRVLSLEEHQRWFDRWDSKPGAMMFIFEDEEGAVGHVSLELLPSSGTAEFGHLLVGPERARGKRYGTIATLAMLWLAWSRLGLSRVQLSVRPDNVAAIRAYEAAGFVKTDVTDEHGGYTFTIDRPSELSAGWDSPGVVPAIRAAWDSDAERAHRLWLAEQILSQLPRDGGELLEVGCGTGLVYRALIARGLPPGWKYLGVDTSYGMLAWALARHPEASLLFGNLWELEPAGADVVVCCEVVGHIPAFEACVDRLVRATRRHLLLSLWMGENRAPDECIEGVTFPHIVHPRQYVYDVLGRAAPGARISEARREGITFLALDTLG